ncbi:MAG: glycosyltransferase family 2 protein [Candidatus Hatepunaea meridiana]|nr:glycosyltransferase family 2 protein [Candidatus Hatepunaea meridiana]
MEVSVIIPHAGGWEMLLDCLTSLYRTSDVEIETIIVENGSYETITDDQIKDFPELKILRYDKMLGFAGACNRGVEIATGKYIFLLNNDAIVKPNTVFILYQAMESDNTIAACQPKILSLRDPSKFDYSSACGGKIDLYGFPFARGRIFDTVEYDTGQYDNREEIFWGAGSALIIRRDLYNQAGGLEEPFFAHMEEIDLQWRLQLMGYRIIVVPEGVVHHLGAATIRSGSFTKMYLNHRNNLAMIFRNYGFINLLHYFPTRLIFDLIAMVQSFFTRDFKRSLAIVRSGFWFWLSLPYLITGRLETQRLRRVSDRRLMEQIYPRSIVWQYFIKKHRKYKELAS